MANSISTSFEYIAFDEDTRAILSHGFTRMDALMQADQLAPRSPIYVLETRSAGAAIWDQRMDLSSARRASRDP